MEILIIGIALLLLACILSATGAYIKEHYVPVLEWASLKNAHKEATEQLEEYKTFVLKWDQEMASLEAINKATRAEVVLVRQKLFQYQSDILDLMSQNEMLRSLLCDPDVFINDFLVEGASEYLSERAVSALEWIAENKDMISLRVLADISVSKLADDVPGCGRATAKELKEFAQECVDANSPEEDEEDESHSDGGQEDD